MEKFSIALAQLEPTLFDKPSNLAKAEKFIRQAASRGAAVILFPELYLTGYSLGDRAAELAERLDGPSVQRIAEQAKQHRIAVLMGFAELNAKGDQAFDAIFVADAGGRILGSYRKNHLYEAEKGWFLAGDQPFVVDFGCELAGLQICYDLEFPEAARSLALSGAKWIAASTGNMVPNQHLQEVYLQARAAENRLWVALANRVGSEAEIDFFGGSGVADPWGKLTAQAGDQEELLLTEIDLKRSQSARLNADYLADRRPQLYKRLTLS